MTRTWLIVSIGVVSFGVAACGDYDKGEYDKGNAAYDEGNAAYNAAGNEAYDTSEGNAAYAPPADENVPANNLVGEDPAANVTTNRY